MSESNYYNKNLSAENLKRCYDIAKPRIQQYLEAELTYLLKNINTNDIVLELGCGYGRIFPELTKKAKWIIGIDTAFDTLVFGKRFLSKIQNCSLIKMNAIHLGFCEKAFDKVICIQNGISAFNVNQKELIKESIRVTKYGGLIFFSSYSPKFWNYRLEWFEMQSRAALIGEINYEETGNGIIVCKDGFSATTVNSEQFISLADGFNVDSHIEEVDQSSIFFEITKH